MEPIYRKKYTITSGECDPFTRIKPSAILGIMQDVATEHFEGTNMDWPALAEQNLFFAIVRQHVQITRLPRQGETIALETWVGHNSRTAYPRNTVAYDEKGCELFRSISLWVLMDMTTRAMVLPRKSGIFLEGTIQGDELPVPASLKLEELKGVAQRQVVYSELDRNQHMNNCRPLDWTQDLFPSPFHRNHPISDFTVCYFQEAREGDKLVLHYEFGEDGALMVNATVQNPDQSAHNRVFAVRATYL